MSSLHVAPRVAVRINGSVLTAADAGALEEVAVHQRLSLPGQCELTFVDPAGPLAGAAPVPVGAALRVTVNDQTMPVFDGEVTAAEYEYGPSRALTVRVRGYDRLHRLRKRQPVKAHVQVNVADLARELVADLGLTVEASETGPLWPRLIQHRQSDFDLLVGLAERSGLYLALDDTVLRLLTLEGRGEPIGLALGESLFEARLEVNAEAACRSVHATGWNPSRIERHDGRSTAPRSGRRIGADASPAGSDRPGERLLTDEFAADDRHAEALAQAELDRRTAREVAVWGTAEGDARLRPGARIAVRGVAGPLAGRYVLTAVTHRIRRSTGFVSEISSVPPTPRPRAGGAGVTWGMVTRVDDPESRGRVRVSLPTLNDAETDWLGVLSAAAGRGKGFVALPDVGDQVLVLLAHEDAAQGIVLGGLYGVHAPPDYGVDKGAVRRYTLVTPGGHKLVLDDGRGAVRLEDSHGSYLDLAADKVLLHSTVALEIEAPGRPLVIRADTIDFRRA